MTTLAEIAPTFVGIAHRIVWVGVATVDGKGQPRTRVLHPIWEWDGDSLVGWIATDPGSPKAAHLAAQPVVSMTYWDMQHDYATADCEASWHNDDASTARLWKAFEDAPPPLGYDPRIIPQWASGLPNEHFGALRLDPVRLRTFTMGAPPDVLTWKR
jgi:general stress protein 26